MLAREGGPAIGAGGARSAEVLRARRKERTFLWLAEPLEGLRRLVRPGTGCKLPGRVHSALEGMVLARLVAHRSFPRPEGRPGSLEEVVPRWRDGHRGRYGHLLRLGEDVHLFDALYDAVGGFVDDALLSPSTPQREL